MPPVCTVLGMKLSQENSMEKNPTLSGSIPEEDNRQLIFINENLLGRLGGSVG